MTRGAVLLKPAVAFIRLKEWHNWVVMISRYTVSSKKMGPSARRRNRAHHTPSLSGFKGTSWKKCEFSLDQILLFCLFTHPLRWKHASSLKKTVSSKLILYSSTNAQNHLKNCKLSFVCSFSSWTAWIQYGRSFIYNPLCIRVGYTLLWCKFCRFSLGDCNTQVVPTLGSKKSSNTLSQITRNFHAELRDFLITINICCAWLSEYDTPKFIVFLPHWQVKGICLSIILFFDSEYKTEMCKVEIR
jgi:hypothetical protein